MANIKAQQQINIMNGGQLEVNEQMLLACLKKVGMQLVNSSFDNARIIVAARKDTGWLEYTIVLDAFNCPPYVIGAIQRTFGAEIEFHS